MRKKVIQFSEEAVKRLLLQYLGEDGEARAFVKYLPGPGREIELVIYEEPKEPKP